MNNYMLGLETMGTRSYSVIMSLACVQFDLETGKHGESFYCTIDMQSSLDKGLIIDESTKQFWREQRPEIFARMFENNMQITEALLAFNLWLRQFNNEKFIWGNSVRFDLGLLENAYEKCGLVIPWKFYNERCCRTIVALDPSIRAVIPKPEDAHDPIVDCRYQIEYVVKTIQSIIEDRYYGPN